MGADEKAYIHGNLETLSSTIPTAQRDTTTWEAKSICPQGMRFSEKGQELARHVPEAGQEREDKSSWVTAELALTRIDF